VMLRLKVGEGAEPAKTVPPPKKEGNGHDDSV
jgi:hypothetical protein